MSDEAKRIILSLSSKHKPLSLSNDRFAFVRICVRGIA